MPKKDPSAACDRLTPGKQKGPARTPNSEADTSASSLFQQGMLAARDLWMGPIIGEPGKIGELENETWACELSTAEAIRGAEPANKLSALRHGIDELQERLCASGNRYYNECFELALRNRAELDATLSVVAGELGRTPPVSNPAEFARAWTTGDLSAFLRVSALDGKEKAQEIGSDGRVREFIRHVCGDYSDVLVDPDAEQNKVFLLPRWPTGRTIGAMMVQRWMETNPARSPLEETEEFILGTEEVLIKNLRRATAQAHRLALVTQASVIAAEGRAYIGTITTPGSGIAKAIHEDTAGGPGEWADNRLPEFKGFVGLVRSGRSPESLRGQFSLLFTEVIDGLPPWQRDRLFKDAQGRRLGVPDLMDVLAQIKHLTGTTLIDYRKQYRRKTGKARSRRSAPPSVN